MDPLNVTIVALLFAGVALLEWADRRDLVSTGLQRLRVRLGRRLPAGRYLGGDRVKLRVGRPDTTLVFKLPLTSPGGQRELMHIAATDAATRFSIDDRTVSLDELLESYDDSAGTLVLEACEAGKLATVGIDTGATTALV